MRLNGFEISSSWIRFGVQIVIMFVVGSGIYFKLENRVENIEAWQRTQDARISSMDTGGTRASHEKDLGQQIVIDSTTRRVEQVEKSITDLTPKVDRMDANIMWLMAQQKNGPK